jgi:hypothetical protein
MKKEATPKRKGLETKTSNEKRGNPQNERGLKQRAPMKKEAIPKMQGAQNKELR